MAIIDRLLRFSNGQDLSQNTGDYASTDVIDFGLGVAADPQIPTPTQGGGVRDMGIGTPLWLFVQVQEGFASADSTATLQITIQGAPDDGTGVPGAYVSWWSSPLYAVAELVQGARLLDMAFPRPPQGDPVPRFVRLLYSIATQITTLGTVFAAVVLDRPDYMYNGSDNAVRGGYRPGVTVAN